MSQYPCLNDIKGLNGRHGRYGPNGWYSQAINMVKGMRLSPLSAAVRAGWFMSFRALFVATIWSLFVLATVFCDPAFSQQSPVVDRISIEGNTSITEDRIRSLIETRTDGILRSGRLNNAVWLADLDAVESFYHNSGFLEARVRPIRDRLGPDRVALRIVIDEGPRYTVRQVNLTGFEYLPVDEVRRTLLTREGQVFYRLFTATDKRYIQSLADRGALLDMTVESNIVPHGEDHTVTVNFLVVEGHPIRVGAILVRGLQKTKRDVVVRELELEPGELYDNGKIALSQTRLFQTGLFRSVRISPLRDDTVSTVRDLVVDVTELPGGEVSFGAGFASAERFRGSYSVAYRNWLGRGITIGTNGQISSIFQQVDVGITQPWLFRTRTTGTLRAFFRREDRISHTERETGMSVSANRELSRTFRGQMIYTLKNIKVSSLSDELAILLSSGAVADSLRSRREGSLTGVVSYDSRDDILNPKTGFFGQLQSSLASPALGSSTRNRNSILTLMGIVRKYLSIPNAPDLSTSFSFSYVRALDNNLIPLDSKLFIGGDRSVRGFSINQIGQPDGGLIAVSAQNELRVPFSRLTMAFFVDWGGIGKTVGTFSIKDFLVGYGGGLRVNSPIGLIRGDVGFHGQSAIDESGSSLYDRTYFYFGLGQAF